MLTIGSPFDGPSTGLSAEPGLLRVGGTPIARHQLCLALALGCERVVCLAASFAGDVIELQHAAERAGTQFHVIGGARALSGLVTSADELIVLEAGLFAAPETALDLLRGGPAVIVQPIETGLPAGFERIDLNHAAGGAMRVPGRLVERLSELPADCDPCSSLLRIALQSGVTQRMLPASALESHGWVLVRSEAQAHEVESAWMHQHTRIDPTTPPGMAAARLAVRAFGTAILHAGSGGKAVSLVAALLVLLGAVAGWFGFPVLALVVLAIAWIIRKAGGLLGDVEIDMLRLQPERIPRERLFGWIFDVIFVAVLVWTLPAMPEQSLLSRSFAPLILIGLARLLPRAYDRDWAFWVEDRSVLCGLLAVGAIAGYLGETVCLLALAMAFLGVVIPAIGQSREKLG